MHKLYLTTNKNGSKREYYSYKTTKSNTPIYIILNEKEVELYLRSIAFYKIERVREINESLMEVTLESGAIAIIDSVEVFNKHDRFDNLIRSLQHNVKNFIENERIREYKNSLPQGYIPKVNRRKKRGRLLISGISLAMSVLVLANLLNLEINKSGNKDQAMDYPKFENSIEFINEEEKVNEIYFPPTHSDTMEIATEVEDDSIKVEFEFEDWTSRGKLQDTITNCSPYMDNWINRYGLPKDLTYALVSLEYGILDCEVNRGGACGPMQLQVGAQHGEHYKVPIYENGVFTGEYDEFWAADINKLDDPNLVGRPIKVIQNLEDNFQIGCAYFRRCIDKYKNIFLAVDAYNKGLYALPIVYKECGENIAKPLEYYMENFNDFSWTDIIPNNSKEALGVEIYGDPTYIWDVLKYLETDDRGSALITYLYGEETITVDLFNKNVYNNGITKG